jgi:hypothetical protein
MSDNNCEMMNETELTLELTLLSFLNYHDRISKVDENRASESRDEAKKKKTLFFVVFGVPFLRINQ